MCALSAPRRTATMEITMKFTCPHCGGSASRLINGVDGKVAAQCLSLDCGRISAFDQSILRGLAEIAASDFPSAAACGATNREVDRRYEISVPVLPSHALSDGPRSARRGQVLVVRQGVEDYSTRP
jgi:hypothetical protein